MGLKALVAVKKGKNLMPAISFIVSLRLPHCGKRRL
jgi:hypothetical protein